MATTMTEIPIKDLALTTAPAGKQLLVRDASAGLQRIDYDQIAKNLVESYGSSSLAGKNQSIKAAIDSLNSGLTQCNTNITTINNSLSKKIDDHINIPFHYLSNINLNTLINPGIYCIREVSNAPENKSNHCFVIVQNGGCGTSFQFYNADNETGIQKRQAMSNNQFTGEQHKIAG